MESYDIAVIGGGVNGGGIARDAAGRGWRVLLCERAGQYRPQLAQGSSFAAAARIRAGLLFPHTETATRVICGTTAERAAEISRETRPGTAASAHLPAYEVWRRRIADSFVSHGGVTP